MKIKLIDLKGPTRTLMKQVSILAFGPHSRRACIIGGLRNVAGVVRAIFVFGQLIMLSCLILVLIGFAIVAYYGKNQTTFSAK